MNLPQSNTCLSGMMVIVKRVDNIVANVVNINPFSGDVIDGGGRKVLVAQNDKIILVTDASGRWFIIG